MKFFKNKKGEEGGGMPFGEMIGWVLLIFLILFMFAWISGLGNKIVRIVSNYF
ncbi:hypothetical protein ISS05_03350 [Candidatus Woesearchaeota archaeon]|nr:hypothetical protein [Candidatus Woesearchaeota archaeon]